MFIPKTTIFILGCFLGAYLVIINQHGNTFDFGVRINSKSNTSNVTLNGTSNKKYLSSQLASRCRLGNHLFELVSLVGIARSLKRIPVFFIQDASYKEMLEDSNKTIPGAIEKYLIINSSVPKTIRETVFHERCCIYQNPKVLLNIEDDHIHLTGTLYQSPKYFPGMRDEILSWLRKPTNDFPGLPKSDNSTNVICVHSRRGDFLSVGFQASNDHFIREAVKYIGNEESQKNKINKVVIFGDDANFMKKTFNEAVFSNNTLSQKPTSTHFISRNSPSDDIIYSKYHCDVVLISASQSSFGWWIGYVSKYNKVYNMDMRVDYLGPLKGGLMNMQDFYPAHWIPLKFAADNITIIVGDK